MTALPALSCLRFRHVKCFGVSGRSTPSGLVFGHAIKLGSAFGVGGWGLRGGDKLRVRGDAIHFFLPPVSFLVFGSRFWLVG